MSKVIGKYLNVSGKTMPKVWLNIAPSKTAKPAIKVLPKIQFKKFGFSSVARKYGRTATIKSVANIKMLSKLSEKNVRPNSTAKKNRTNEVSTVKPLSPAISLYAF